jgi:hypothetical protein
MSKVDMLLINLPWWDLTIPHCGTAVLKGIGESQGFKIKTHDFSIDLKEKFSNNDHALYEEFQIYFLESKTTLPVIDKFYDYVIKKIEKFNPKYLGISVFSIYTQKATIELLSKIKEKKNNFQIVVGGRGVSVKPYHAYNVSPIEKLLLFSDILKKRKLVDHVILGDGEDALIELLSSGNIDSESIHQSSDNLDYPFSNFDDVQLEKYKIGNQIQLPVVSSKGCVRACDFCDVAYHMAKFKNKDGSRLSDEIIHLSKKYNINSFNLADSIANGNMKSLRVMCESLARYNAENVDKKISWSANWICRFENTTKPEFFDLLKASGCESLTVGVESGSNAVLKAMNKKSSVEGVLYEISQFDRVGIKMIMNNVLTHWSEKFDNFLEHLEFLIKIVPYVARQTITAFWLGRGFFLLHNTPAATNSKFVISNEEKNDFWYNLDNPQLTPKIRFLRILMVYKLALYLRYPVISFYINLKLFQEQLQNNKSLYYEWTKKYYSKEKAGICETDGFQYDLLKFIDEKIRLFHTTSELELNLEGSAVNGLPEIEIRFNNSVLFDGTLEEKITNFKFYVQNNFENKNRLEIRFKNKGQFDTLIDDQHNIIKDKKVLFRSIRLDKIEILKYPEFFYKKSFFNKDGTSDKIFPSEGLYYNGTWCLEFDKPFWQYFLCESNFSVDWLPNNNLQLDSIIQSVNDEINSMEE